MDEIGKQEEGAALPGKEGGQPNAGRRRFGMHGLKASSLLLTLACKPVLGSVHQQQSPSGFLSVNQSRHGSVSGWIQHATGPEYWRSTTVWPISSSTRFSFVFSASPGTIYDSLTLLEMVAGHKDDVEQIGMYLTAALLSARSGWTDFLPETTILAMFLEWRTRGYYAPVANVQWNAVEIVKYLKATMVTVGSQYKSQA
jgi:hypothetical protein